MTMSVFVTDGSELRATAILEGPVAPPNIDDGKEINTYINKFQRGDFFGTPRRDVIKEEQVVDFEQGAAPDVYDDDDDDYYDDDEYLHEDYYDYYDDDEHQGKEPDPEKVKKRQEMMIKRREKERQKRIDRMRKIQEMKKRHERTEGEPYQITQTARVGGWYRACVRASWYQVSAEMEFRKSSELGPPDPETGHVKSYESRELEREEEEMDKQTPTESKEDKDAVKEEDFDRTKDQLKKLNRLLNDIKAKQMDERHRLSVHAATNEHSHSRMVLSSLMETVLYMMITGFQVYTIRKWFSGSPLLGR